MEKRMTAIAIVAMGEMGSGIAGRLVENGARVLTSLDGRSAASADRARAAGVEDLPDAEMIEEAEVFLSIVPPSVAAKTAERFLPLIERSRRKPTYLECNATAPRTVLSISEQFAQEGLHFGDAAIIGVSPKPGSAGPRVYMSGPVEKEAELLRRFGLDTRILPGALGDASALKMAYAGTTKGAHAVMISMMLGAVRAGVGEAFVSEMRASQAGRLEAALRQLPMVLRKAYRWDGEMEEIARFLEPEAGGAEIFRGAAELYRDLAKDVEAGEGAERLRLLDQIKSRV